MNQSNLYYQHSGKFSPLGIVLSLIFGTIAAVVASFIYAYALHYIPFIYLNFIITVGFGIVVGFAVGIGAHIGKIRNSSIVLGLAVTVGLAAVYIGWVAHFFVLSEQEVLFVEPMILLQAMQALAVEGAWSVASITPTGGFLYFLWFIEAAIILGGAVFMAWGQIASEPFCEKCNKWVEDPELVPFLEPVENVKMLVSNLESGNFKDLENLKMAGDDMEHFTQLELLKCSSCSRFTLLTVKDVTISYDDEGEQELDDEEIVENMIITPEVYDKLLRLRNAETAAPQSTETEKEPETTGV
ncbi:MAG: hypothetical protein GY754_43480 [bacterium]|nr:hypothetical protein [bacterium]